MTRSRHYFTIDTTPDTLKTIADSLNEACIPRFEASAHLSATDEEFENFKRIFQEKIEKKHLHNLYFSSILLSRLKSFSDILEAMEFDDFQIKYEIPFETDQFQKFKINMGSFLIDYDVQNRYYNGIADFTVMISNSETIKGLRLLIASAESAGVERMNAQFGLPCERDQFAQIVTALTEENDISELSVSFKEE